MHIIPVLQSLQWLPINYRAQFKVLAVMYNVLCGPGPSYLYDYLSYYALPRQLRPSEKDFLLVLSCKLNNCL